MQAQLGDIVFEGLIGFDSFERKYSSELAKQGRIGGKPKWQLASNAADEISFSMKLHVSYCNPEKILGYIYDYVSNGNINAMILGNGTVLGSFIIKEATERTIKTDQQHNIIYAIVQVSLVEYWQPLANDLDSSAAISDGFANADNGPIEVSPNRVSPGTVDLTVANIDQLPNSDASLSGIAISRTSAIENGIDTDVKAIALNSDLAKSKVQNILRGADAMEETVQGVANLIDADVDSVLYSRTRDLSGRIPAALMAISLLISSGNDLLTAIDNGNALDIATKTTTLTSRAADLKIQVQYIKDVSTDLVSLVAKGG